MIDLRTARLLANYRMWADQLTFETVAKGSKIMRTIEDNRAVLAAVLIMVAFNGLFLSANGIFMLVAPLTWYELVPGVTDTGFFNQHFVRDIGMIQLFLGVASSLACCDRSVASASGPPRRCG